MAELSDNQRAILMTRMSATSCAGLLGRSQARPAARRAELAEPPAPVPEPSPAMPLETPPPEVNPERQPRPKTVRRSLAGRDDGQRLSRRAERPRKRFVDLPTGVLRVRSITPATLRYAGWFLAAGWSSDDTAALFDLTADGLTAAIAAQARP